MSENVAQFSSCLPRVLRRGGLDVQVVVSGWFERSARRMSRMGPTARLRDGVASHHPVVATVRIRQHDLRVVFQKLFRSLSSARC